jgi:hypothetical protein
MKYIVIAALLLIQRPDPRAVQQAPVQDQGPDCENKTNDAHQCQCKGMPDGPTEDEDGNALPVCTHRCKKNACCCPRPKG